MRIILSFTKLPPSAEILKIERELGHVKFLSIHEMINALKAE